MVLRDVFKNRRHGANSAKGGDSSKTGKSGQMCEETALTTPPKLVSLDGNESGCPSSDKEPDTKEEAAGGCSSEVDQVQTTIAVDIEDVDKDAFWQMLR